jgi:outer membrane protein assembly factor BamE (lipoprotein component of BamABCDE complex)
MKFTRLLLLINIIIISSCTYYTEQQGILIDEEVVNSLELATDNKTTVRQKLGDPSFKSINNPNIWYYVGQKNVRGTFQEVKIVDHKVIIIAFDQDDDSLQALSRKGMENYTQLSPVLKTTATAKKDYTLIEELLGSFIHRAKKFSKQQKK